MKYLEEEGKLTEAIKDQFNRLFEQIKATMPVYSIPSITSIPSQINYDLSSRALLDITKPTPPTKPTATPTPEPTATPTPNPLGAPELDQQEFREHIVPSNIVTAEAVANNHPLLKVFRLSRNSRQPIFMTIILQQLYQYSI